MSSILPEGSDSKTSHSPRLLEWLRPHACCGAPHLCGAQCQSDEITDLLAHCERAVRCVALLHYKSTFGDYCSHDGFDWPCPSREALAGADR